MAPSPLVDVETFSDWLGHSFSTSEYPRAEAVLGRVSSLVTAAAGGRTWAEGQLPDDIGTVVLEVSARVWHNPKAVTQQSTGPFGVTYKVAGAYLTPEERALVGRYRVNAAGLWTLGTTRDDTDADTVWVPVVGTESLFPFLTTEDV
jgi:hypothetical protein